MSKQLYEEALADAKRLKEVAEDNAKRALVEAVTPRIRDLIEKELLREADESDDVNEMDHLDELELGNETTGAPGGADLSGKLMTDDDLIPGEFPSSDRDKVTLDLDMLDLGDSGAEVGPPMFGSQDEEEFELSNESVDALTQVLRSTKSHSKIESTIHQIGENLEKLSSASTQIKRSNAYADRLSREISLVESTYDNVQNVISGSGRKSTYSNILETYFAKLNRLQKEAQSLRESKNSEEMNHLTAHIDQITQTMSQVENMYGYVQENIADPDKKHQYENKLESYYKELSKLQEQTMFKKGLRNLMIERDVTLKLTGLPDELDLDSIGVDLISDEGEEEGEEGEEGDEEGGDELELDLGGEEEGEEPAEEEGGEEEQAQQTESRRLRDNVIVEIDEGMLRREISRMRALREDAVPSTKGAGPGKAIDAFGGGDDEGDPWLDAELTLEADDEDDEEGLNELDEPKQAYKHQAYEADDMLEMDDDMLEAEDERSHGGNVASQSMGPGAGSNKQSRQVGQTVESLRRRLQAEIRLQTEAKGKAKAAAAKKRAAENKKKAAKTKKEAAACGSKANQMKEAYDFYVEKFNESVRRANQIKNRLNESIRSERTNNGGSSRSAGETVNLRNKLAETNLFNAKLVYTNKLLQNESLSKRQKAEIIERLDEAQSLREVTLVYESLTKTLAGTSRPLAESADRKIIGSSSRATRPASTNLTEGFETDRWARLAGITK
jgi:hypothetical protein